MGFKQEFMDLMDKYDVVFDVSDRKEIVFRAVSYPDGIPEIKETITISFNPDAEYCEFVAERVE